MFTASAKPGRIPGTRFSTYDITLDLKLALAEAPFAAQGARSEMVDRRVASDDCTKAPRENQLRRAGGAAPEVLHCLCLSRFAVRRVPLGIQPAVPFTRAGFAVSLVLIFSYYLLLNLGAEPRRAGQASR